MSRNLQLIRGFVFEDDNRNGIYQIGKKGIPGVVVSNQHATSVTDENGYYTLPVDGDCFIFISKPSGYKLPLKEDQQYHFYYLHQPEGTPCSAGLQYDGIEPTGSLPDLINFPLIRSKSKERFKAVFMGDIQPKFKEDIDFFQEMVVCELMKQEVEFFVPLGDITWDDLSFYPDLKKSLTSIGLPYYPVIGNHDINLKAKERQYTRETYKKNFGPNYYSFNEGAVHFVVLDSIGYNGWDTEQDKKGECKGWLDQRQLEWLKNDLQHVAYDQLIVFLMHIPIYTSTYSQDSYRNILNREALFDLLKHRKYLLSLSAHTHCIEHVELTEAGWDGSFPFPSLIAGAACGAWWKGPRDFNGHPVKMGMDGSPNGFYVFSFEGSSYTYDFHPIGYSKDYQMNIRFPKNQVNIQDLEEQPIVVNAFNASLEAVVECQIDQEEPILLERVVMEDPHVVKFLNDNQAHYPDWMYARKSSHIWTAPLPSSLGEGIHTIAVSVTEPSGKVYKEKKSFTIQASNSVESPVLISMTTSNK